MTVTLQNETYDALARVAFGVLKLHTRQVTSGHGESSPMVDAAEVDLLRVVAQDALLGDPAPPLNVWLVFTDRNVLVGAFASEASATRYAGQSSRVHITSVEVLP